MSYYPVTWQGYAVLVGYVVLLSVATVLIKRSWLTFFGAAAVITIVLMIVVAAKSDDSSI